MRIYPFAPRFTIAIFLLGFPVQANEFLLTKDTIAQIRPSIWTVPVLEMPEPDAAVPILGPKNTEDGARLLRIYNGQRSINGFTGIVYDNRDRGHSTLKPDFYPRLTHLKYGSDLTAKGFDFGLAGRILLPVVVLGNSSAALTGGPTPRSLPRLAMTNAFWRSITPTLYANNHIYVYPEHRDHDADDRFPVNWPYMIISQGSSGSDLKFLNAVAMTLASLPQDTFAFLRDEHLIAPTMQMILRRNLANVSTREDYLSGLAHPAAFDGKLVRTDRMMTQAADLRPEDVPPQVRLRIIDEDFSNSAGLAGLDERLLDSPTAIGRLWRSFAWQRELLVTAEDTSAPNDRKLSFEWRLLRGDPQRVRIEQLGPDRRVAKIRVAWHDPWTELIPGGKSHTKRRFSRVDIGIFANNGVHDSAPAIISIDFPEHQVRRYSTDTGDEKRLLSIDYDAKGRGAYFDPLLYWSAAWSDTARYDAEDVLLGWDRQIAGDAKIDFVPIDADNSTPQYEIDLSIMNLPSTSRDSE